MNHVCALIFSQVEAKARQAVDLQAQVSKAAASADANTVALKQALEEATSLRRANRELQTKLDATDAASQQASAQFREMQVRKEQAERQVDELAHRGGQTAASSRADTESAVTEERTAQLDGQNALLSEALAAMHATVDTCRRSLQEKDTEASHLRAALAEACGKLDRLTEEKVDWIGLSPLGNLDADQRMAAGEAFDAAHNIEMQMRIEILEGDVTAAQASAAAAAKKTERGEKKLLAMESELAIVRQDKAEIIRSLGEFEAASEAESEITARALESCEKKLQKRQREQLRLKHELAEARWYVPPGGLVGRRRHILVDWKEHPDRDQNWAEGEHPALDGPSLSPRSASSPRSWLSHAAENELELQATIDELQFEKVTLEEQHAAAIIKVEAKRQSEMVSHEGVITEIATTDLRGVPGDFLDQIETLTLSLKRTQRLSAQLARDGLTRSTGLHDGQ